MHRDNDEIKTLLPTSPCAQHQVQAGSIEPRTVHAIASIKQVLQADAKQPVTCNVSLQADTQRCPARGSQRIDANVVDIARTQPILPGGEIDRASTRVSPPLS